MDLWNFYQNDARLWFWTHTDEAEVRTESKKGFNNRTECIADAMKHGYRQSPPRPTGWAFSVRHEEVVHWASRLLGLEFWGE